MTKNPLGLAPKREKSGSKTLKKYHYQYHWAFCRLLDEHKANNEYAIFVEEHEDVTLADSLDAKYSKFEFNQVKEVKTPFTIKNLTKQNKTGSVLTKISSSVINKIANEKIKSINLVATGGFRFQIHKKGYEFDTINSGQLDDKEVKALKEHLLQEVGNSDLIKHLAFIVPSLPAQDYENAIKGRLTEIMHNQANGSFYNVKYVYDCIIAELYKKGTNYFDYLNWEDAIKKKAITSKQVQDIMDLYIKRKPDESLIIELNKILSEEYNLKSIARQRVCQCFERYYLKSIGTRDIDNNEISREFNSLIKQFAVQCITTPELESKVKNNLSERIKEHFIDEDDFRGTFLYEFLKG